MHPLPNTSFAHTNVESVAATIYTPFGRNTSFFDFTLKQATILDNKNPEKEAVNNLSDFKLPLLIFIRVLLPPHWSRARTTGIPTV